jgi:Tfp pilus assembly protein PilF
MGRRRRRVSSRVAVAATSPRRNRVFLPAAVIVVAALLAYANSFDGVFVYDDEPAIVDNAAVQGLWPPTRFLGGPPDVTVTGRPVAALSFAINYVLARDVGAVRGYHAANVAIHVLAALTLFGVIRRTLARTSLAPTNRCDDATVTWLALATALVWTVHPLQTAAVTYIVQRVESLMGLFYLLTLYGAIRSARDEDSTTIGHANPRPWWSAVAVITSALGMATKEPMVTAPIVVVLWDYVFDPDRMWSRRWRLYAGLAGTWAILAALVATGPRPHSAGWSHPLWPWQTYLATEASIVVHYLRLAVVPYPLVFDYEWRPVQSIVAVAPQAVLLLFLLGLTIWLLARRHPAGFAGAWFFLVLAPTSSVFPIVSEAAAEHRMYLPLASVAALAITGAYLLGRRAGWRTAPGVAAAAAATIFIAMTASRNGDFSSAERLWGDTIAKRPANARAQTNFATPLLRSGRYADAEQHLRVAVAEQPNLAEAQADLGVSLCGQRKCGEGIEHLQRAIAIDPSYGAAHHDLAEAYASQGRLGPAVAQYSTALALDPDNVMLLNRTAWILATAADDRLRDGARAVDLAEKAVRLTGRQDAISLDTLAAADAESGHFDAALAAGEAALRLARASGDRAIVPELEERLALYRARQKFRQ